MLLYAAAIFTSAFLLFQVQPIIAKMILPWFGGSAAVWTTCMLFFQLTLLGGYLYAHFLVRRLPPRAQSILHLTLLAISLAFLPLRASPLFKPTGSEEPISRILLELLVSVGLPYFLLSTTGPLIQAWYARDQRGQLPYRLFALSNLASLLALIAYPFAVEPALGTSRQGVWWSGGYLLFVILTGGLALRGFVQRPAIEAQPRASASGSPPPTRSTKLLWIALAAFPSIALMAVSNHLSQNVAAIPFLWIVPLSVYLLSFVFCFDSDNLYQPLVYRILLAAAIGGVSYSFFKDLNDPRLHDLIPLFTLGLFVVCMFGHGELARRRPAPEHLTAFYLMLSIGGALGGLLVTVGAPLTLPGNFELPIAVVLLATFTAALEFRKSYVTDILWMALAMYALVAAGQSMKSSMESGIAHARNFYGALKVQERGSGRDRYRTLVHGTINHGEQYMDAELALTPGTYYGRYSGPGIVINALRTPAHPRLNYAVIGLGIGTMSAFARPGDQVRFYEINPQVPQFARAHFLYLKNAAAPVAIAMGDARVSMEREPPRNYDIIAVDAFSSDSIPVHLLTREAVELYLRHLQPEGVVAIHVSNKYLNLPPVVRKIAESLNLYCYVVENEADESQNVFESDWVLLTRHSRWEDDAELQANKMQNLKPLAPGFRLWTDEYSNLFQVLK